jgi:hypothetical protein
VERSPADEAKASDVAVADLPTTSGAHWANRDHLRNTGEQAMFRRPPAASSFAEDEQPWDAFGSAGSAPGTSAPGGSAPGGGPASGGFGSAGPAAAGPASAGPASAGGSAQHATPDPMTDTGSRSRASFGMTDEPISGNWLGRDASPVSPAGPSASAPQFPAAQPEPIAVELPVRMAESPAHTGSHQWQPPQGREPLPPAHHQPAYEAGAGFFSGQHSSDPGHQGFDSGQHSFDSGQHSFDSGRQSYDSGYQGFDSGQQGFGSGQHGFGEPGHEIRAHRAPGGHQVAAGHHHQAAAPRRSKGLAVATVTLSALVLLGGVAAGITYFTGDDKGLGSVLQLGNDTPDPGAADTSTDDTVATAPIGNRTSATFELVAATRRATVKTQDLGGELYRITSAAESGTAPRPTIAGEKVQLLLETEGAGARGNVQILLSSKVTWSLRFTGGADEQLVDLTGGKLSAVDLSGASRRVNLTLPQPSGTVQVRIAGAIEDLSLTSPSGSPVRVRVDGGVKTVSAGTRTLRDLEPGSTLTPKDWKTANRYDVAAEARLSQLTVKTVS